MRGVNVGDIIKSRTGKRYKVVSVDASGFVLVRLDSSKASQAKVTWQKVEACLAMLKEQGFANFQENPSRGGFSYTVTIEVGIAYALRDLLTTDAEDRVYRLK